MDTAAQIRQVKLAAQAFQYAVTRLPYPGAFGSIHAESAQLTEQGFHNKQKPWLNPYELAFMSNYVALFGSTKRNHIALFDVAVPLNKLKLLWKLAEEASEYSDSVNYEATFVLRLVYQQQPFAIHPLRTERVLSLMRDLLSTTELAVFTQNKIGLSGARLIDVSSILFNRFSKKSADSESILLGLAHASEMRTTLKLLAADRATRLAFYNRKLRVQSPVEKPYELNSLLRFPLIKYGFDYYAPHPGLIGYAATRGIFFRFSEEDGGNFRVPFVRSYEAKTASIVRNMLPKAEVLTEEDERKLGWNGKTNDVTAILGDCALLIECKLSGLFVDAKRTASPDVIIADIRKQIADGKDRRGLFQLHDKCDAIRSKALPAALQSKYKNVHRFFPVLLLFDAIQNANAAEILGNIIQDELKAYGIGGFEYQIWHLEELSWLADHSEEILMEWIAEKFSHKNRSMDLNSFIGDKTGEEFLRPLMYMPEGNTRAFRILKELSEKEKSNKYPQTHNQNPTRT